MSGATSACELLQRSGTLSRESGAEVDTHGPEIGGAGLLWCVFEDILSPSDLEVDEARVLNERFKLCIQQSAGDSTRP